MPTAYSIVIVTRNRPDALALSLPLHLGQSRRPEAIFVIDSSDDPTANQELVARLKTDSGVPLEHVVSPSGMTVQRNIGLAKVKTEVVFFPDDDSLVYPGAMDAMMRVYDRDTDKIVGGVCTAEAMTPPPGVLEGGAPYELKRSDWLRKQIARRRFAFEERFFTEPFHKVAEALYESLPNPPTWLGEENAVPVPLMSGFRMSFRTEVIRRLAFNEHLGRYALFEDMDASLRVLQTHLLIGARNARIYHHKAPTKRANGRALGAMQILNRAYIIAGSKIWHGEPTQKTRIGRTLRRFTAYKLLQYALASRSKFGRDRYLGARMAAKMVPELLTSSAVNRDRCYLDLRQRIFASED